MTTELVGPLLAALDDIGLTDAFPAARKNYARIAELHTEAAGHIDAAHAYVAGLTSAVVAEELTLAVAVERAAPLGPWLAPGGDGRTVAGGILADAVDLLEQATASAIASDALDVYQLLADRAGDIVGGATDAAAAAADVGAAVAAARRFLIDDAAGGAPGSKCFVVMPPLPGAADPQTDPRRAASWNNAASAASNFHAAHRAAALLRAAVDVPPMDPIGAWLHPVASPRSVHVLDFVPEPLRIAVAAGLGWQPGIYGGAQFPVIQRRRSVAGGEIS